MSFEKNTGVSRLANVLSRRMRKENESPLILDFGEIQTNDSLMTNTFPVAIPKGDYSVCKKLLESGLSPGDNVLVAWVQNEAVVIDIITSS